ARGGQYHGAEQHYSYRPELHAGLPVQGIPELPYALRAPLGMAGGLSCYWLVACWDKNSEVHRRRLIRTPSHRLGRGARRQRRCLDGKRVGPDFPVWTRSVPITRAYGCILVPLTQASDVREQCGGYWLPR